MDHLPTGPEDADRRRILNYPQAAQAVGLSVPTLERLVRRGDFPPPIKLSARRVGWKTGAILDWLASRETTTA